MATPTPEQLMALPQSYMQEVNITSKHLYNTSIAFVVVNTLVFGFFIFATHMTQTKSKLEMYFLMPIAYLSVLGNCLTGILLVKNGGLGRHLAYHLLNNPDTITMYLKLQTGVEIIYMASVTFPKIAILLFFLRIFVDRVVRALVWVLVIVMVMFFIAGLILALALCRPYAFKWDKTIHGTCGDIMAGYRWVSIPSIVTDFFILVIPIPVIWKLQMNRGKKIGVILTFMVGGLGFVTAIVRCLTFYRSNLFSDPTFLAGETMAWTIVESSAYFICACLPRFRQPITLFLEKTKVGSFVESIFSTVMSKESGSQATATSFSKGSKASKNVFDPQMSNDTVGLVPLGELRTGSQTSQN